MSLREFSGPVHAALVTLSRTLDEVETAHLLALQGLIPEKVTALRQHVQPKTNGATRHELQLAEDLERFQEAVSYLAKPEGHEENIQYAKQVRQVLEWREHYPSLASIPQIADLLAGDKPLYRELDHNFRHLSFRIRTYSKESAEAHR